MSAAGTLETRAARKGITAQEVAQIALETAAAGQAWQSGGCTAFVWGVTNLAGAPFLDMRDMTVGGDPTRPQDAAYVVPHTPGKISGFDNVAGDGWVTAATVADVDALRATLAVGDVVRVYRDGNTAETSYLPDGRVAAHSFVVTGVEADGTVQVTDNWFGGRISTHSFETIARAMAPSGQFEAAFVARLDEAWAQANLPGTLAGNGKGDFTGVEAGGFSGTLETFHADGRVQETQVAAGQARLDLVTDSADRFEWAAHATVYDAQGEVDLVAIVRDDGVLEIIDVTGGQPEQRYLEDRSDAHLWDKVLIEHAADGSVAHATTWYDDGTSWELAGI